VYDNMWNCNAGQTLGPESIYACSPSSWYVVSDQWSQGGAVMTFPAVQYNFPSGNQQISGYTSMSSSFAEISPHVGIYEFAYDIWLNGVASSSSNEIMIWVDNFGQTPAGDLAATTTLGGVTYNVFVTSPGAGYIAFVPTSPFSSGTVDLLSFFQYAMNQGWIARTSTILQLGFGPEIVSTQSPNPTVNNGASATFYVNDFSLSCSPACP
jgi:hypothetical protein